MRKLFFAAALFFTQQVLAKADLSVSFTGATQVQSSSLDSYSVRVSNLGSVVIKNATLSLALPQGVQLSQISVVGNGGLTTACASQSGGLACSMGRVYLGVQNAFEIRFKLKFPDQSATINLVAVGSHSAADRQVANNSSSLAVTVTAPVVVVVPPPPPPVPVVFTITIAAGDSFHFKMCGNVSAPMNFSQCFPENTIEGNLIFLANGATDAGDPSFLLTYMQPNSSELRFTEYDTTNNNAVMSESVGVAVSANCFEGVTTFRPPYSFDGTSNGYGAFRACK